MGAWVASVYLRPTIPPTMIAITLTALLLLQATMDPLLPKFLSAARQPTAVDEALLPSRPVIPTLTAVQALRVASTRQIRALLSTSIGTVRSVLALVVLPRELL